MVGRVSGGGVVGRVSGGGGEGGKWGRVVVREEG